MPDHSLFRLRILPWCIALAMSGSYSSVWAEDDIQFDSRFLELKGDTKIDLKRFSSQGYVEPGKYNLQVQLNKQPLAEEYDIYWYAGEDDVSKSYACLTPELVAQFGLKEDVAKNLQWSHDGKCLKPGQLEGMEIKADLSQSALVISLPQAYLEYTWPDWDPPSRWDDGISGIIADYSITAQTRHEENGGDDSNEISGNGTVGVNLGPWRMRADWQTNYQHTRSNDDDDEFGGDDTQKKWEWSRYYAWRALPSLKAKLALGEDYLNSDIFDGFNYVGGSVSTDDQMLPPNLRGYAPDISGVAHTTAKVTVSQMGRVIYETQVPAGPFRIQDLGDSVSGTLHIRIEEQNGQVQEYDISTASMPYLTRPGQVRYKIMMGRPQEWGHHVEGGFFSGAEASWGIANGWSLYGGALGDENYQSAALGVGRDLSTFGAVAFDVTHSHTKLDKDTAYGKGSLDGNSFRVSYSKDFDQLNSRVTFAGYRFSEENFMTMSEYLDASDSEMVRTGNDKEMYTATYNQNFRDAGVSVYLNYTRHTYWDREEQTNYNIMLSHYFNMGSIRNMSVSLTGYRYEYDNRADIDLNKLPENAEATQSVVQATLTEGAIGYRKFAVISGQKAMAVLRLQDGSHPPFGAEVKNDNEQTVGLVDDDGNVYLAGVKPGEHMSVFWSGVAHCDINLPDPLPADLFNGLLLPCQHKGNVAPVTSPAVKPAIQEQTQRVTPTEPPTSISVNQ
ncbi:TPA: outer membrane usher protein [Escherichia coli]|uniref:outer membrane usher protein n=1 Tax=Escherichia coli TaxID=562 RepID=UPI000BDE6FB3|nr:outer membrane usher protein [Escherichia coli]EFB5742655.1 outer membrane usher protein [Escherichia coli]EFM5477503.1 outer membrane usher protein [Escherichia coli]EFN7893253.1 outer membrane usher protein [Escherichia coli]EFO3959554.1 outer membrane usher protein [Escherichia coli]EGB9089268.1 outer membrane usher protein [Escherichia coli]